MMDKERRWGEEDRIREIAFTKTITVILLLSRPGAHLIPKILGAALVRGRHLKGRGAYFKVKKAKQVKFQHFSTFSKKK